MSVSGDQSTKKDESPSQDENTDRSDHSSVTKEDKRSTYDPDCRNEGCSTKLGLIQSMRLGSPRSSYLSLTSDQSMADPVDFGEGGCPSGLSLIQTEKSDSFKPSCVSMQGNQSMADPVDFRERDCPTELSSESEKSNVSQKHNLESIFKELEEKAICFLKNELQTFKKLLKQDYPACIKRQVEDVQPFSSVMKGALEITLHVLKTMNQMHIADMLQTKLYPQKFKSMLKKKIQRLNEGISYHGNSVPLNEIYTDLYITEGGSGEVNTEHEVRQIETVSRRASPQERPIKCNDIFKPLPGQEKHIRTVLTRGVAGIGKTVFVQKFILDWAEGRANQDVTFIFPLPFRELNLIKEEKLSLMDLLHQYFRETKEIKPEYYSTYKVMFIFDGLDECRLPLDFQNNESLFDITQSASVDVLLTNLIKGNLLPSALLWVTTRPAAANQICPEYVNQVTEVRGFGDPQKEEYFRKRISDQSLAEKIISHIKSSRSLYIMCHIPVFCWITATVLERMCDETNSEKIPKTLTQMFTHFLIFQIKHMSQKFENQNNADPQKTQKMILALGKLAFQQLEKGNLIFCEEDLRECGIDVREVSVHSGVCTQIFREDFGLHLGKVFSFVHLSVQEFLAALFRFLMFTGGSVLEQESTESSKKLQMSGFLKHEVDQALQCQNGYLDLFLRFLLGLSLESNQTLLQSLLPQIASRPNCNMEMAEYIKKKIREDTTPEQSINLFHCLSELNDSSLTQEFQTQIKMRNSLSYYGVRYSPYQWSALAFVLLNSKEDLNTFVLSEYDQKEECFMRLLPVAKESTNALLNGCKLTERSCEILATVLSSHSSRIRDLSLSDNQLQDLGVKLLSVGLKNPHCRLKKLKMSCCNLTEKSCAVLASVLSSGNLSLRELDMSINQLQDSGVKLLSAGLGNPLCKLKALRLYYCGITEKGCADLVTALKSNPSHLRELNLSYNKLGDSGGNHVAALLEEPDCELEILDLWNCDISYEGCVALAKALHSNPSHLRELYVNDNDPDGPGVKLFSALLENVNYKLQKLNIWPCI